MGWLSDRVVLLSGIVPGAPCDDALEVARAGARVVLGARDGAFVADLARRVTAETGAPVRHLTCDPLLQAHCRALVDEAVRVFGGLDCLVHHVFAAPGAVGAEGEARAHDAAVVGSRRIVRAALPALSASPGGGSIVFVAPPHTGSTRRSAAAHLLAREVGRAEVRVNTVVVGAARPGPGLPRVPRARGRVAATVGGVSASAPGECHAALPEAPVRPLAGGCAAAVVYLASSASRSVTGQTVDAASGRYRA